MAPDWSSPTEDNGVGVPRGVLSIALVAPDHDTAVLWRRLARVVKPPLWKGGTVNLYIVTQNPAMPIDAQVAQAMVDLGLVDSVDVGLIGYPSGLDTEDDQ